MDREDLAEVFICLFLAVTAIALLAVFGGHGLAIFFLGIGTGTLLQIRDSKKRARP